MKRHRGEYKQAPRKDAWELSHLVLVDTSSADPAARTIGVALEDSKLTLLRRHVRRKEK